MTDRPPNQKPSPITTGNLKVRGGDDACRRLEDAKEHLAWLKKVSDGGVQDLARIIGYEDCLRDWQAAYNRPAAEVDEAEPFDIQKARKDLKPAAWELLEKPVIKSLLYDINLLPEQITQGKHWFYMLSVLMHMDSVMKQESPAPDVSGLVGKIEALKVPLQGNLMNGVQHEAINNCISIVNQHFGRGK